MRLEELSNINDINNMIDVFEPVYNKEKKCLVCMNFFDNSMDIILGVSKEGKIIYANKRAVETYGYTYEELLDLSVFDLRNQDVKEYTKKQLASALNRGIHFQTYHYKKDGTRFPVEVRSIYCNKKSRNMVISIIRDITNTEEISREASMFSRSLEIFEDAIIVLSQNFDVLQWSIGAEEKFGYSSDEIVGKNINIIFPDDSKDELVKEIDTLKKGEIIKNFETTRVHKNGNIVDVAISAAPLYDFDGIFVGVVGIYRDISEKKMLVEKLKEYELEMKCKELELLKEEADNASRAKSMFLANMSHEIRTPLNGIVGAVQLLQETALNEEQKRYTRILKESSDILNGIIDNVLDVSKIEFNALKLNCEPFDLRKTINSLHENLLITGNIKGLEVSYYLDPSIDFNVEGDELRLKQILSNLINNAVKFTEEGFVSFRVERISSEDDCQKLEFKVKDTGIGIEDSFKGKIFNNFSQGDLSTRKKYKGTGLGLAIAKQLASLMNGDIWFESSAGKGSTFYFTCEFKKSNIKSEVLQNDSVLIEEIYYKNLENDKVILCVEDNIINQEIMENIIKAKGYKYIAAYNGEEALEILKSCKIDLILMDVQMPKLNGFETTKIIRNGDNNRHIPIIAMTAYAMREDRAKCIAAGMDDYIPKPLDTQKLFDTMEHYLSK